MTESCDSKRIEELEQEVKELKKVLDEPIRRFQWETESRLGDHGQNISHLMLHQGEQDRDIAELKKRNYGEDLLSAQYKKLLTIMWWALGGIGSVLLVAIGDRIVQLFSH